MSYPHLIVAYLCCAWLCMVLNCYLRIPTTVKRMYTEFAESLIWPVQLFIAAAMMVAFGLREYTGVESKDDA